MLPFLLLNKCEGEPGTEYRWEGTAPCSTVLRTAESANPQNGQDPAGVAADGLSDRLLCTEVHTHSGQENTEALCPWFFSVRFPWSFGLICGTSGSQRGRAELNPLFLPSLQDGFYRALAAASGHFGSTCMFLEHIRVISSWWEFPGLQMARVKSTNSYFNWNSTLGLSQKAGKWSTGMLKTCIKSSKLWEKDISGPFSQQLVLFRIISAGFGQTFGLAINILLGTHSRSECPSSLLLISTPSQCKDDSSTWIPTTHVRYVASGSQLWPGTVFTTGNIWRANQQMVVLS